MKRALTLIIIFILCYVSLAPNQVMGQSHNSRDKIRRHPEAIRNQYIVVLNDGIDRNQVSAIANNLAQAHGGTLLYTYENGIKGFSVRMPEAAASAMSRNPIIDYIEEDAEVIAAATQSNSQWGLGIRLSGGGRPCAEKNRFLFRIQIHGVQSTLEDGERHGLVL